MQHQFTSQVVVSGKGATRQQAFAAALSKVQQNLLKETEQVLLRVEPLAVKVLKAEESIRVEKFLFFFLPRTRHEFRVELEIQVSINAIDTRQLDFTRV
ncbi:DUF4312 family protein [Aeromonas rivuli]|jgi:uncharacterized protein (TIGR03578 family)|uniref:DUF4312 family protein n=1 Tax=Aeromonas TaxID=642 RepID=UPI0005A60E62|nr:MULTISPECIES: DUF4312 family protein [Aeromonas]MCS3456484.1 uncharacterized protein (TIGR03578 family) [Aeromonas sp. BIGb0405]MCS3460256.1 uncharacterized protein (TIGR03578 family) [Aeromonas sp. BIGb0445]UBO74428.1 DUF4312 family protein [Aeromonas rivuli]